MNEYQWFELVMWSHERGGYVPVGPTFDTREDADAYADRWFPITPVEVRRRRGPVQGQGMAGDHS